MYFNRNDCQLKIRCITFEYNFGCMGNCATSRNIAHSPHLNLDGEVVNDVHEITEYVVPSFSKPEANCESGSQYRGDDDKVPTLNTLKQTVHPKVNVCNNKPPKSPPMGNNSRAYIKTPLLEVFVEKENRVLEQEVKDINSMNDEEPKFSRTLDECATLVDAGFVPKISSATVSALQQAQNQLTQSFSVDHRSLLNESSEKNETFAKPLVKPSQIGSLSQRTANHQHFSRRLATSKTNVSLKSKHNGEKVKEKASVNSGSRPNSRAESSGKLSRLAEIAAPTISIHSHAECSGINRSQSSARKITAVPKSRLEYTFYIKDAEDFKRPFFDKRVEALVRSCDCTVELLLSDRRRPPIYHKGLRVCPVTISTISMVNLKRCLAKLDNHYPQFNVKAFFPN